MKRETLPSCQYGARPETPDDNGACGAPAVAIWSWNTDEALYVCEWHDQIVAESEDDDDEE